MPASPLSLHHPQKGASIKSCAFSFSELGTIAPGPALCHKDYPIKSPLVNVLWCPYVPSGQDRLTHRRSIARPGFVKSGVPLCRLPPATHIFPLVRYLVESLVRLEL